MDRAADGHRLTLPTGQLPHRPVDAGNLDAEQRQQTACLGQHPAPVEHGKAQDAPHRLANVAGKLRHDTVMVFNGDVLSGADLGDLLAFHQTNRADVTLHLVRVGDPRAFGCVPTDDAGRVVAFLEKTQDPPTDQINAGCYVFQRGIIDRIPRDREVSVEREVFPALLSDADVKVCGYVDASYWRDMGTPEVFVRGSSDLVRGIAPSPALKGHRGEQLVHDGAAVSPGALLIGGTVVGRGAEMVRASDWTAR